MIVESTIHGDRFVMNSLDELQIDTNVALTASITADNID